jgi:hypothetical protein
MNLSGRATAERTKFQIHHRQAKKLQRQFHDATAPARDH